MEGSAIKGMSDAKKTRPKNSYIGRIRVMGYNTEHPHDDVESSLRKLFSSCGEITDVYIRVLENNILNSFGFVYFLGEGAVDKALQLSGSDMGGWNVIAEPRPFPKDADWIGAAAVHVYGECAEEKVLDLDGSYIGERKISVKLFSARKIYTVHRRPRGRRCPICPIAVKKAKMTSED